MGVLHINPSSSIVTQMNKQEVPPLLEKVRAEIADFTVGFVTIRVQDQAEDASSAGSGTLVTVGSIHGILTAAHVLRGLPNTGKVGIARFPQASLVQKLTIDMSFTDKLLLGREASPEGPDLGFLWLPPTDAGTLKATNSFFNLSRRRNLVLSGGHPSLQYFDGISGVIGEWTNDLPAQRGFEYVISFGALYGVGCVVKKHDANGFDLLDFEVTYDAELKLPQSFGGMSGGALWRVYCSGNPDGQLSVTDKKVFGVAFYQSGIFKQKRIITCHGPNSVYGNLIDAIQDRWPESSSPN